MRLSNTFNKEHFLSFFDTIRSLPKFIWALLFVVFFLGFLIRGGGEAQKESQYHTHDAESTKPEVWTCSMHPQVRLPEPGQCPICFMDLIPLETEDTTESPRELKMSPTAMKLAEIVTTHVCRAEAETEIRLSGKVEYDETKIGKITAWVPGRLEKLYVNYTGTLVKKGEPLVELYSPALYAAQEELLQSLKINRNSKSELAIESAQMTLEATREKLRQLGLTDKQVQKIETRGTAAERMTILSPMSGIVTHKNALEGLYVNKETQIYTIVDLSAVWVVLDAYESDLPWIKEGQKVDFTVEAFPGKTFKSKVDFVDPILNEKTRTIKVRLNVNNHETSLKPGLFVRATIHARIGHASGKRIPPLVVPVSAVLKTGKRAVVYIKKPDTEEPVFEGREVELGSRAGDYYIIESGLEEGEEVVVKGNFKIDSAFQIAAKPSMMNPEGGVAITGHEHHGGRSPSNDHQSHEDH